jgi:hypothetical protein
MSGTQITWRQVWRGRPMLSARVRVIEDDPGLLAVYLAEGTPFVFFDGPFPTYPHPWSAPGRWQGPGLVMLQRPGDAYAVWVFWAGADRAFDCWYVNFQAPFVRGEDCVDTLDHELDLWSADGREWHWKDAEMLDLRQDQGWFTPDELAGIRAAGSEVYAELTTRGMWWDEAWRGWTPLPAWSGQSSGSPSE